MRLQSPTYILDDDDDLRQLLHELLSSAGFRVKSFATAGEFVNAFDPDEGGCLILDVHLPDENGIELLRRIHTNNWHVTVIMITARADVATAVKALKDGAFDFFEKPIDEEALVVRVSNALTIDADNREKRLQRESILERTACLTPRELEVMALLVDGKISKQIAQELGCSVRTIESHRGRVMHKMNAVSIADLVRAAILSPSRMPKRIEQSVFTLIMWLLAAFQFCT